MENCAWKLTIISSPAYSFHFSHLHHGSPALVIAEWIRGRYLISKQRLVAHSGLHELWLELRRWPTNVSHCSGFSTWETETVVIIRAYWGWVCMNGSCYSSVGVDLGYAKSWGWTNYRRVEEEREEGEATQREAGIPCIFFYPLTLWDPKRGPASGPTTFPISVLRRPCHLMGFFSFFGF